MAPFFIAYQWPYIAIKCFVFYSILFTSGVNRAKKNWTPTLTESNAAFLCTRGALLFPIIFFFSSSCNSDPLPIVFLTKLSWLDRFETLDLYVSQDLHFFSKKIFTEIFKEFFFNFFLPIDRECLKRLKTKKTKNLEKQFYHSSVPLTFFANFSYQ